MSTLRCGFSKSDEATKKLLEDCGYRIGGDHIEQDIGISFLAWENDNYDICYDVALGSSTPKPERFIHCAVVSFDKACWVRSHNRGVSITFLAAGTVWMGDNNHEWRVLIAQKGYEQELLEPLIRAIVERRGYRF